MATGMTGRLPRAAATRTAHATGAAASTASIARSNSAPDISAMACVMPRSPGTDHCSPIASCAHIAAPARTTAAAQAAAVAKLARAASAGSSG